MKPNNDKVKILGITGGIGCGKSTVSNILNELGGFVIDCDKISRELMTEDNTTNIIKASFPNVVNECGEISRKKLADIVFNDKTKLDILNSIMHKEIANRVGEILNNNKEQTFFVIDLPIPIRDGFLDKCNKVWVIVASLDNRIKRIKSRDNNLDRDDILARINSQLTMEEYIKFADLVIYNDDNRDYLRNSIIKAYKEFINFMGGINE